MSELASQLLAPPEDRKPKPGDKVRRILDKLDKDDRAALERVLRDPSVSTNHIAKVLTAAGHRISHNGVERYRDSLDG